VTEHAAQNAPPAVRPVALPILATAALLSVTDASIYAVAAPARFESAVLAALPVTGKTLLAASLLSVIWYGLYRVLAVRYRPDPRRLAGYVCTAAILAYLFDWATFLPQGGPLALGAVVAAGICLVWSRVGRTRPDWRRDGSTAGRLARLALWGLVFVALASSGVSRLGDIGRNHMARSCSTTGHAVPHVILIVVDTLRADALSCYGSGASTPHLDALARDSVVFEGAHTPAPWTLPSMASLMTGVSPSVHRVDTARSALLDDWPTLAEQMRDAGYRTGAIGRNRFLVGRGFEQGFQSYDLFPRHRAELPLAKLFPFVEKRALSRHASTEDLTDRAMAWIEIEREQDFFLWLHLLDPHQPYTPPAGYTVGWEPAGRLSTAFDLLDEVRDGSFAPTPAEVERVRDLYLAEVQYLDAQIGRFLQHLRQLDHYDEALIILTSDHGEELWDHGGYEHGHTLYEELLHVPLLIKLPRDGAAARVTERVDLTGVPATILELCDLPQPPGATASLRPYWLEGVLSPLPIHATATLYGNARESVIFGDFKLVHDATAASHTLHDLLADSDERYDLAGELPEEVFHGRGLLASHAARSAGLRQQLGLAAPVETELSTDAREQLRELGYVE